MKTTAVHRLLRVSPGSIPRWVLSDRVCGDSDVYTIVVTVLMFFVYWSTQSVWWFGGFLLLAFGFDLFCVDRVRACERFARAEFRRKSNSK